MSNLYRSLSWFLRSGIAIFIPILFVGCNPSINYFVTRTTVPSTIVTSLTYTFKTISSPLVTSTPRTQKPNIKLTQSEPGKYEGNLPYGKLPYIYDNGRKFYDVEVSNNEVDVLNAIWADDYKKVLYAVAPQQSPNDVSWHSFVIETGIKAEIDRPTNYDPGIWEKVGIAPPYFYPEFWGYVAPSGKKVIYYIQYPNSEGESYQYKADIWLANMETNKTIKLIQTSDQIVEIQWFQDEKNAIFNTQESLGPKYLEKVNTITGKCLKILQLGGSWSLSPTNNEIAVYFYEYENQGPGISLFSIPRGNITKIDLEGRYPFSWSSDGKRLYYWALNKGNDAWEIRKYDLESHRTLKIVGLQDLEKTMGTIKDVHFSFSPDERYLLLWYPHLWIVDLEK